MFGNKKKLTVIKILYLLGITMVGNPAEIYLYGHGGMMIMTYVTADIGGALLAAVLFVPMFYSLQITSVNTVNAFSC